MFKSVLALQRCDSSTYSTFEHSLYTFFVKKSSFKLLIVYRLHRVRFSDFINEFTDILESMLTDGSPIITGDFNIHVDDDADSEAARFLHLLECFDLEQHVVFPTHVSGHTLDLVITKSNSNIVSALEPHSFFSDHRSVCCSLHIETPVKNSKRVSFRKTSKIIPEIFAAELGSRLAQFESVLEEEPNSMAEAYFREATTLLDEHAPLQS